MEFSEAHEKYAHDIRVAALSQRVPGLDYDDVVQEMTACLWKACASYKGGNFPSYWWSIWLNRKIDLIRRWTYRYPTAPILTDEPEHGSYEDSHIPPPPDGGELEHTVWGLLAQGYERQDVLALLQITRHRYYNMLRTWKRDEVREGLRSRL